jgi:hypothetical protein
MSPQKIDKAISTFVLSSINGLWSRLVALLYRLVLVIVGIVRKQSEIHNQTLEENRAAVAFDIQAFHQCVLQGEQQAKCFTLALLLVVFVSIVIVHLTSIN